MWRLLLTGALATIFILVAFEALSNKTAVRQATRQLWANLFSIRLFADNPRVVLQSLGGVMAANLRLLLYALPPLAVIVPVYLLSYGYLETLFGSVPLSANAPRVLTVRLRHLENGWPDVRLETPDWIVVDFPPVHILDEHEISWRIRATRISRGAVTIIAGQESVTKVVDSHPGQTCFSLARMQSWAGWIRYPAESRLPPGDIAEVNLFGAPSDANWTWQLSVLMLLFAFPAKQIIRRLHP